jgi:hypothetical protein
MADLARFPAFAALDAIDWTLDREAQHQHLLSKLPALRAAVDEAVDYYRGVTVWPTNPMVHDDTWGDPLWDNWYHARASLWLTTAQEEVEKQRAAALHELDLLEYAADPATYAAGNALQLAHQHLKSLGLESPAARAAATPQHASGQPVAVVIWEARNQHEHWPDAKALHPPVLACFRLLLAHKPSCFGVSGPVDDDQRLTALLKKRSWAPQVLLSLGWTNAVNAAHGLGSIR